MKLKRVLALLTAAVMVTLLFSGCSRDGDKTSGSGKKQLNIAVFEGGYGKTVWEELKKAFEEKNKDVTVNITSNPKLGDVVRPQLMSGNKVPDFIYLAATNDSGILQSLIKEKGLTDLSDVYTDELKEKMLPGVMDGPTVKPYSDGKVYSMPLFYSGLGLWYNKKLFADNNWEVPKTWDEFFQLGDKAKSKGIALFTYPGANAPSYNESVILPSITSAGGPEALDKCFRYAEGAWKSDAVKKVFDIYGKIASGGYLLDGTVALNHTQSQTQFINNKALFIPNGSWLENEMKDTPRAEGFEFGFAELPTFGDEKYVWVGIEEMYIPKKAANPDLAKKFMSFLYEDDTVKLIAKHAKGIPPVKGAVEIIKPEVSQAVYESYKAPESGYTAVTGDFAVTSQSEVNIKDVLYNNINSLMNGKTTVAKWMEDMQKAADTLRPLIIQ